MVDTALVKFPAGVDGVEDVTLDEEPFQGALFGGGGVTGTLVDEVRWIIFKPLAFTAVVKETAVTSYFDPCVLIRQMKEAAGDFYGE